MIVDSYFSSNSEEQTDRTDQENKNITYFIKKYVIFSFSWSGNETKRGVEFRHPTLNVQRKVGVETQRRKRFLLLIIFTSKVET